MAQNPHEYLIEQLQFTGDESVGSSSNKIKLNFNHPCKELVWVVQPDSNVDYCSSLECGTALFALLGAQPFNYTDATDALPNAMHAFAGPQAAAKDLFITSDGKGGGAGFFHDPGASDLDPAKLGPKNQGGEHFWGDGEGNADKGGYEGGGGAVSTDKYYGTGGQAARAPRPRHRTWWRLQ